MSSKGVTEGVLEGHLVGDRADFDCEYLRFQRIVLDPTTTDLHLLTLAPRNRPETILHIKPFPSLVGEDSAYIAL